MVAKSEIAQSIILHYFAEYWTYRLTSGLRSYRPSNLVVDLKMWGNLSQISQCAVLKLGFITDDYPKSMDSRTLLSTYKKIMNNLDTFNPC